MSTPKRVVHITTVHHPTDPRIYHKECLSLKQAGFDVYLVAKDDKQTDEKPIKHVRLKSYKSRLKRMIFGTIDAYKKAKRLRADIYHFHDPELMIVGWLLKKKSNVVIYDIHEDYVTSILQKQYVNRWLRLFLAKLYKILEKLLTRRMELCLAEKYYYDIYKRGVCVLNYPLMNDITLNNRHDNRSFEQKVLYTGNVTEDRGALIHARLPLIDEHISVHFIGKCDSQLADQMKQIAANAKDRITIEGVDRFVEKEDIEKAYINHRWLAGIAIFPPTDHYMKKELTKFFEYMNAGLPIICSNFPVWKSFVETYECGIAVDPYDETDIKRAIDYLRDHPEEARRMGKNGKRAVSEKLNWQVEERKLINWYNELLKGSC